MNATFQRDQERFAKGFFSAYRKRMVHPINYGTCILISLVCALIGPFDTYSTDPFWFRIVFWLVTIFSGTILANFIAMITVYIFPNYLFSMQAAVASTFFVPLYFGLLWSSLISLYPARVLPEPSLIFLLIAACTAAVFVIMWGFNMMLRHHIEAQIPVRNETDASPAPLDPQALEQEAPDRLPDGPETCAFLERLELPEETTIIRLAMSDHYIQAFTNRGAHLVYMRFADAIDLLKPGHGSQVHRSHWVNYSQIKDVAKDGAKVSFVMADGATVPIARCHKKRLQDLKLI